MKIGGHKPLAPRIVHGECRHSLCPFLQRLYARWFADVECFQRAACSTRYANAGLSGFSDWAAEGHLYFHVPIDCLLLPLIGVSQACFDFPGYLSDKCCVLKADYLPHRAHVATACINVSFEDPTLRPLPTCPAPLPPSLECTPRFSRRLIALVWSTVPHLHTLAEPCCIAAVS